MKVAVIIPCHNVAVHVEHAVRSVWAQEDAELDIVAVDDGSTDGTLGVLEKLMAERPGSLRVLRCAHAGAGAARNAGLWATDAPYLQFLDADDALLPDKIGGQLALAMRPEAPALIAGGYRNYWEDGRTADVIPVDQAWSAVIQGRAGTTSANLWARGSVVAVGGWDEQLASSQDHDLAFRILRGGGSYVADPRVGSVILKRSGSSISRSDPVGNWERFIVLRAAIRDHLRTSEGNGDDVRLCEHFIFGAIRAIARTDQKKALHLRDHYLGRGYEPGRGVGSSRAYVLVHRLFGFRAAQAAAKALDILRPSSHG